MAYKKKLTQYITFTLLLHYSGICISGEYYYDLNLLKNTNFQPEGLTDNRMDADLNIDGVYNVNIYINEKSVGYANVTFKNINGLFTPELSDELINKIGFSRYVIDIIENKEIHDLLTLSKALPDIRFEVFIDKRKMILIIPQSNLRYSDETFPDEWDYGMNSFFSSYDFSGYNKNDEYDNRSKSQYLNLYNGINFGKWQLRNKTYYNEYDNKSEFYSDQTWLSRDIGDINSRLTIGQTTTSGLLTPTFRFDGIKIESISDMRPSFMNGYLPDIQGNALTNATVKVFQGDNLIYQSFVNPGAFSLSNIPVSGNTDLRVQVVEENGSVHEDLVPVSSSNTLRRKNVLDYSVSIGKQSSGKKDIEKKEVLSGEVLYGLTSYGTLLSGVTYANTYQSMTLGGGFNFGDIGASSILATKSLNQLYGKDGVALEFRHFKILSSVSTQFDLSHQLFFGNFSSIDDEMNSTSFHNKKSITSLSVNQPADVYGNFRVAVYLSRFEQRDDNKTTYSLNWNKYLYGAFYTLSSSRSEYLNSNYKNENVFSVNVSIPIGGGSKTYIPSNIGYGYTTGGNYQSSTLSMDKRLLNDKFRINIANSKIKTSGINSTSNKISTAYSSDYSNLYLGISKSNRGFQQNSWRLSGSVIAHPYGITTSPYSISNAGAFGVISIPGASGISLNNYLSATDYFGNVLINNLRPYKKNKISINGHNLPANVELYNIEANVIPANGAIIREEFNAHVGNKAILNLLFNGKEIPFGSTVQEDPSSFASTNGILYVTGLRNKQKINVNMPDDNRCSIIFDISNADKRNGIYFYDGECK